MEVGIRVLVGDVSVETAGSAVIPVTRLSMILRESRDETLAIEATPDKTLIKGKGSKFELQAQNPSSRPTRKAVDMPLAASNWSSRRRK